MTQWIGTTPPAGGVLASVTLSAGTSDPIYVPASNVGIEVVPTSGTARFEQTAATKDQIEAGTAHWFVWSTGDVAGPASSIVLGANAVRGVATGNATFYVRF